jgi:mevalonate pyrophosphate decarboxylase
MSHSDFGNILDRSEEIELTVKGRKSDKENKQEFHGNGKPITDENKVKEVVDKFRSKYGVDNIARYYTVKGDAMVEFSLQE